MKRPLFAFVLLAILTFACGGGVVSGVSSQEPDKGTLEIQATSEIAILANAGIFNDFASQPGGVPVNLRTEKGSVELKLEIQSISADRPSRVHAYITADPFFMPGTEVREKKPIMMSLTTLVVDRTKAQALGWAEDLHMIDVVSAARASQLKVCSASASQDAAALNFFLAALTAIKGDGTTLRLGDLDENTPTAAAMEDFYSVMVKGAFNSDALRQSVLNDRTNAQATCDAVVLPESGAIALNRDLTAAGKEPMQVFYVSDATSVQIYTMGCVDKVNADKLAQCQALEKYLQSPAVQEKIIALGFRANDVGYAVPNADPVVFNAAWGVRTDEPLAIDMPKDAVVEQAINLYQTALRPGSYTCYVLDFSPSMEGNGRSQLLSAMKILLDQTLASSYALQASPKDTWCVVLFSDAVLAEHYQEGNDADTLYQETDPGSFKFDLGRDPKKEHPLNPYIESSLYGKIYYQLFGSGTNIYGSTLRGLEIVSASARRDQLRAVILLTDGQSNIGPDARDFQRDYPQYSGIPVYAIGMGSADEYALNKIAEATNGAYCDGRSGEEALARCFRTFKGSN